MDIEAYASKADAFLWPEVDPKLRRKRERILRAATELFAQLGYRKTSVDAIARGAGVAKGTIYLYYRNKAEIVLHALALEERAHMERLAPVADPALPPRERLRSFIALGVRMSREMPLMTSLMQGDNEIGLALAELDEAVLLEMSRLQTDILVELLREAGGEAWPAAELAARAQVLLDLMMAAITSGRMNAQGLPWETYAGRLADVLVNGVLNELDTLEDVLPAESAYDGADKEKRVLWGA